MRRTARTGVKVLLVLGATFAARAASAGGFGIPEVGVRRTAMASIIGRPDDLSAIYHNPAGLVLQDGWQLYASFGVSRLDTEFQLASWDRAEEFVGVAPGADGYFAPVRPERAFGVIPMLAATAEVLPGRLVVGAGLYVGNATGAAFDESAVTRYHLIDAYVIAPQAVVAAAYRLSDAISVGASVGVINVRLHANRNVYPFVRGADGSLMDVSGLFGKSPGVVLDGSGWAPSWMIGAFGRPHPRVSWGATVTGRVDAELSGPAMITLSDDAFFEVKEYPSQQTMTQLLPWAFMAGANVDVAPTVEIGAELRYWLYRQYREQVIQLEGFPYQSELRSEKNYHDSWAASGGIRVHDLRAVPALELMAGTQYDRSPAPSRTVTLDQPSFTHWGLHSGVRYRLGRYRLGASYIHYWYDIPTITDSVTSPPSNVRGSGGNDIITASLEVQL